MKELYTVDDCQLIELSKKSDARGNLTFIENGLQIPFDIARVYYIYDVPAGSQRAGHAHKQLFQLMISIAGSFDVTLDDGFKIRKITLNRPYIGLLIVPKIWRVIDNFSSGAVCLAVASAKYDEDSYYRDYDEFVKIVQQAKGSSLAK